MKFGLKENLHKSGKKLLGAFTGLIVCPIIVNFISGSIGSPSAPQIIIYDGGAVPAALGEEFLYQSEAVEQQPLSLSISGYELDDESVYCILDSTPITIEAADGQDVQHIFYKIGDCDTVKLKNTSTAEIRIPGSSVGDSWFTLNVCAKMRDGHLSEWKAYRLSLCTLEDYENAPLIVCTSGTVLNTENTYLLSDGQALCLQATGNSTVTEVQYKFGTGPVTRCSFSGYLDITPPAELTDAGAFSLNVSGFDAQGQAFPWRLYNLNVSSEDLPLPPLSALLDGQAMEVEKSYTVSADTAVEIKAPIDADGGRIYYKIGTSDTVCVPNHNETEVSFPARLQGTGSFSFNVCYVTAKGEVSPWQFYELVME